MKSGIQTSEQDRAQSQSSETLKSEIRIHRASVPFLYLDSLVSLINASRRIDCCK